MREPRVGPSQGGCNRRSESSGWLIIPGASSSKDFDLVLRAPGGSIVATSDGSTRQETIGLTPTSTGTYTVSVESYTGSGSYDIDFSYRGSAAALTHDG
ncbi:MAG: PPC domain-containing protein [Actinomycetota bacterium]